MLSLRGRICIQNTAQMCVMCVGVLARDGRSVLPPSSASCTGAPSARRKLCSVMLLPCCCCCCCWLCVGCPLKRGKFSARTAGRNLEKCGGENGSGLASLGLPGPEGLVLSEALGYTVKSSYLGAILLGSGPDWRQPHATQQCAQPCCVLASAGIPREFPKEFPRYLGCLFALSH